jgi:lysophospholipase L1-like esterase
VAHYPSFAVLLFACGAATVGCGDSAPDPNTPGEPGGTSGSATVAGSGGQAPSGGSSAAGGASPGVAGSGATAGAAGASGSGNANGGSSSGSGGAGGSGDAGSGGGGSGGSAGAAGSGGTAPLVAVTVYLAGDSTVSTYNDTASPTDQAGWGQMLKEYLNPLAKVENRAIGGRTARRFIDEGHLEEISADLRAGDYLLVQFGTNDSNKTATYTLDGQSIPYYLDPATDFKTYLKQYITAARAKQANPILVTPPPRNSAYCTGGNGTGAHAQAMRELGMAEQVAVADLNQRSVAHLKAICPAPTPEDFFLRRADGTVDGTHFQENGARKLASFVVLSLGDTTSTLARYAK